MSNRNFLIKPASSLCNMRCRYCFYEDESENRAVKSMGIMDDQTMVSLISRAFEGTTRQDQVSFAFQGGEPTVAGKDYFRRFAAEVKRQNTSRAQVTFSLQTNGLALDEEWASIFKKYHFLVGVSIDGDKALHDSNRIDAACNGTWGRVVTNLNLLLQFGVEVNLLCVVTKQCAKCAQKVYHALKKLGVGYLQFIACLDPMEVPRGSMPWSLLPQDYGMFLCRLFDAWYLDWKNGQYTSVRLFDDFVHLAMGMPAGTCATSGSCGAYYVVEADGSVYPCDFYVLDNWKMGSIQEMTLGGLAETENATHFLKEGLHKPEKCATCPWLPLCNGGCKRDWTEVDGVLQNYYCTSFQMLFTYAGSRIREIAQAEFSARTLRI